MTYSRLAWFDSHCHFDFPVFDQNRASIWQHACDYGVRGLMVPGITRQQGEQLAGFCQNHPWLYACGLHPYFLSHHEERDLDWLAQRSRQSGAVAVGEIGLDWLLAKKSDDETQHKALQWHYFQAQVDIARTARLPLILHVRGAHDEVASYLRRCAFSHGGVVHAFSGSVQQGKAYLELGFKLGIGGAMTHPGARKLRKTIKTLPLQSWLLETDAPDMRPAFFPGNMKPGNQPVAVPLLGYWLAAWLQCDATVIAAALQQNLQQVFPDNIRLFMT